jgi:hypothetical protein
MKTITFSLLIFLSLNSVVVGMQDDNTLKISSENNGIKSAVKVGMITMLGLFTFGRVAGNQPSHECARFNGNGLLNQPCVSLPEASITAIGNCQMKEEYHYWNEQLCVPLCADTVPHDGNSSLPVDWDVRIQVDDLSTECKTMRFLNKHSVVVKCALPWWEKLTKIIGAPKCEVLRDDKSMIGIVEGFMWPVFVAGNDDAYNKTIASKTAKNMDSALCASDAHQARQWENCTGSIVE